MSAIRDKLGNFDGMVGSWGFAGVVEVFCGAGFLKM